MILPLLLDKLFVSLSAKKQVHLAALLVDELWSVSALFKWCHCQALPGKLLVVELGLLKWATPNLSGTLTVDLMCKIPCSLLAHAWNDPSQTIDDVLKGVYIIV